MIWIPGLQTFIKINLWCLSYWVYGNLLQQTSSTRVQKEKGHPVALKAISTERSLGKAVRVCTTPSCGSLLPSASPSDPQEQVPKGRERQAHAGSEHQALPQCRMVQQTLLLREKTGGWNKCPRHGAEKGRACSGKVRTQNSNAPEGLTGCTVKCLTLLTKMQNITQPKP